MNALAGRWAARTERALAERHVAVLFGGSSSEREVSLVTGREVVAALSNAPVGDRRGPKRVSSIELDSRGNWILGGDALAPNRALDLLGDVDVFFLALHGGDGEDGTIQAWLALSGRKFTGSAGRASALCMDKLATRGVAEQCGIGVAPGVCFTRSSWTSDAERRERLLALGEDGWVVKPRAGGSSVTTFMISDAQELARAIETVLETGDDALIEARVPGVELSCGILGNRGEPSIALPPVEIQPRAAGFFDYREKYASDGAIELCPPRSVDAATIERVQAAAKRAHEFAGCDGYSRSDFIVAKSGELVMLEINTLPGLTPRSLLPQEAAAVGVDYRTLCLALAASALEVRR